MSNDKGDRRMLAVILLWAIIVTAVFITLATFDSCCPCRNIVAPPPETHYIHDTVKVREMRDSIVYKDKLTPSPLNDGTGNGITPTKKSSKRGLTVYPTPRAILFLMLFRARLNTSRNH